MPYEVRTKKATPEQVINYIMQLVKFFPEVLEKYPENYKERSTWVKAFKNGEPGKRMLNALQQLPAFTYMAPGRPSRAAWAKVFEKHIGIEQIGLMLNEAYKNASFKPIKRKKIKYWRDAYGAGEVVQRVRPEESNDYIPNPHRGTATFQRFQGEPIYPSIISADTFGPVTFPKPGKILNNVNYIPRSTVAYCRWPWAWFEPRKGKYNWRLIDETLKAAKAAGQTAQLRFQPFTRHDELPDSDSNRMPPRPFVNMPRWYWDTGAGWTDKPGYGAYEPDHNDPRYLKHFGDFIRAFGKRYDGHPDIESIDVAYGGFWGEAGGNTNKKTAAKLVDVYMKSFKKTQLIYMSGTAGCDYATKVMKRKGKEIGFRSDCIGDLKQGNHPDVPSASSFNHTFDAYPKEMEKKKDAWKTQPITMESCWNAAAWSYMGFDVDKIIREGYRYHMSIFMPKNVFYPIESRDKLLEFDKKIGYRFAVRQIKMPLEAKGGAGLKIEAYIDNVGCAPIYRPYSMAFRFKQGKKVAVVKFKKDIRTLLPGNNWFSETIKMPNGFKQGEVKIGLAIVGNDDKPKVWFAMKSKTDEGWQQLTSIDALSGKPGSKKRKTRKKPGFSENATY